MPFEPDFIDDGDAFTASSVNAPFAAAVAWINDLGQEAVQRGCFNHFQAYQVIGGGTENPPFTINREDQDHIYLFSAFGAALAYSTHGANGSADRTVIGHASAGGSYSSGEAVYTFDGSGPLLGMSRGDRTGCVLAMANIEVREVRYTAGTALIVMCCMQLRVNGTGIWYTLPVTESCVSHDDHVISPTTTSEFVGVDIPIMKVIDAATLTGLGLDPDTDRLTDVRLMVAVKNADAAAEGVVLERYNLSCIPFHCRMG